MILVTSRFRVANGMEADVARAFGERPHLVDDEPGFLGMEVFTSAEDSSVFELVTRWTDAASYQRWHHGESHHLSHKGVPKGLKLDATHTSVKIAQRLSDPSRLSVPEDSARDEAGLISSYLSGSDAVGTLRCEPDGRIIEVNQAMARMLERPAAALSGQNLWDYLVASEEPRMRQRLAGGRRSPREQFLAQFVSAAKVPFSLSCHLDVQPGYAVLLGERATSPLDAEAKLLELNNELAVLARENARKNREVERARADLQTALDDLNASYWHLRKIQEVLPICMDCGKVKSEGEGASWESVVDYLKKHSLFLSHGFCPECAARRLAEITREDEGAGT